MSKNGCNRCKKESKEKGKKISQRTESEQGAAGRFASQRLGTNLPGTPGQDALSSELGLQHMGNHRVSAPCRKPHKCHPDTTSLRLLLPSSIRARFLGIAWLSNQPQSFLLATGCEPHHGWLCIPVHPPPSLRAGLCLHE